MTAGLVDVPEMVVGPVAFKIKSAAALTPPCALVTVLLKVSVAGLSLLLSEQTAVWPGVSVTLDPTIVPAEQVQAPAA